jgi:hypothetical protein
MPPAWPATGRHEVTAMITNKNKDVAARGESRLPKTEVIMVPPSSLFRGIFLLCFSIDGLFLPVGQGVIIFLPAFRHGLLELADTLAETGAYSGSFPGPNTTSAKTRMNNRCIGWNKPSSTEIPPVWL